MDASEVKTIKIDEAIYLRQFAETDTEIVLDCVAGITNTFGPLWSGQSRIIQFPMPASL